MGEGVQTSSYRICKLWECNIQHGDYVFSCSVMSNFAIPCTIACQAPLSVEFSRQESWSGLPFPTPGGFPEPRIEPKSPASFLHWQTDSLPLMPYN